MPSEPETPADVPQAYPALPATPSDSPDDLSTLPVLSKPRAGFPSPSVSSSSLSQRVKNITLTRNTPRHISTFTMKHCKLPIELCEAIMDVLCEPPRFEGWCDSFEVFNTLRACRDVCPEWSIHATALLHLNHNLDSRQAVYGFVSALRARSWDPLYFRREELWLKWPSRARDGNLSQASVLFTLHSLPMLKFLDIDKIRIEIGSSRLMRLRPPFLKGVRRLRIACCKFDSWRTILDLLWACPNLNDVKIEHCFFKSGTLTSEGAARLCAARRNLRGCEQLCQLEIKGIRFSENFSLPSGDVFGPVLTNLTLDFGYKYDIKLHRELVQFLQSTSPQLKILSIYWRNDPDGVMLQGPSLLYALSTGPPVLKLGTPREDPTWVLEKRRRIELALCIPVGVPERSTGSEQA
ncbi:hypothetical protein C8Q79DRAFT_1014677 [Trametes meyenii]|nr:hypothetical protein C8Q79DRAFT_1014677 [Trametes meyenii]